MKPPLFLKIIQLSGFLMVITGLLFSSGCATPYQTAALIAGVGTATGSYSPDHEIEQIYYLGVFDPIDQVPPTIYRVRVHGQASFISGTHFASGWVPAATIDSLGGRISVNPDAGDNPVIITGPGKDESVNLRTGRRLVMFGPEGFREAPADHRLVIVMGSNPSKFFESIDKALGDISQVSVERENIVLQRKMFEELARVRQAQDALNAFQKEVAAELPK